MISVCIYLVEPVLVPKLEQTLIVVLLYLICNKFYVYMRLFNTKKIEFLVKKFFNLSDASNLKRRAKRYLKKNTEREIRVLNLLVDESKASIDIGVYRGVYSYFLTKYSSFVYAFEANPLLQSRHGH